MENEWKARVCGMSEYKRAMKLMWANKRMRKAFGCDFGLRGHGGCYVALVVFAAIPLFETVSGIELKFFDSGFQVAAAFGAIALIEAMMTQSVYGWYGNMGRGFGAFPMAKSIMTKGFLTNLLIYTEIGYLLLLGMRGLCVVLGSVEDSGFDDILLISGLVFFLQSLIQICFSKAKPLYASGTEGTATSAIGVVAAMSFFGEINLSVGLAIFWHLILVIAGGFVYYRFMSARYRARSTVASTEWDVTKQ